MPQLLSDATLLDRFVTGRETTAFAEVVQRHRPRVRATCRRVLASEHDAEDVVQATFLTLALKAGEQSWRDSVGGWLCVVARRLARDSRESASRRGRFERALSEREGFEPSLQDDPANEMERLELRRIVREELRRLPAKYRSAVVLCDLEGLSHREAATRLGLPTGSISRRLEKARSLLRQRLSRHVLPLAIIVLGVFWLGGGRKDGPSNDGRANRVGLAATRPSRATHRLPILKDSPTEGSRAITTALQTAMRFQQHGRPADLTTPGRRESANALRVAALSLERAARRGDDSVVLAAARQLDETCVRCHLAARQ